MEIFYNGERGSINDEAEVKSLNIFDEDNVVYLDLSPLEDGDFFIPRELEKAKSYAEWLYNYCQLESQNTLEEDGYSIYDDWGRAI